MAVKLGYPNLSIDGGVFDQNILLLQWSSVSERHPAETSIFPGILEALEK